MQPKVLTTFYMVLALFSCNAPISFSMIEGQKSIHFFFICIISKKGTLPVGHRSNNLTNKNTAFVPSQSAIIEKFLLIINLLPMHR